MIRSFAVFVLALSSTFLVVAEETLPSFAYEVARSHEIQPHRLMISMAGVRFPFTQLHLTLTVSPAGNVLDAKATGVRDSIKFWPQLKPEVMRWKFTPFEKDGQAVTASIEEYIQLVPPERRPTRHVEPPVLRPDSNVTITLQRGVCFGSCPAYTLTVSTEGVTLEGLTYGKHVSQIEPKQVRELARRFVDADFYSMDDAYEAGVTDMPTYVTSISIDGRTKAVKDYVGRWAGMPEIISELEDAVDDLGGADRWIQR